MPKMLLYIFPSLSVYFRALNFSPTPHMSGKPVLLPESIAKPPSFLTQIRNLTKANFSCVEWILLVGLGQKTGHHGGGF